MARIGSNRFFMSVRAPRSTEPAASSLKTRVAWPSVRVMRPTALMAWT